MWKTLSSFHAMQCSDEESAPSEKGDRVCTCCGLILSREKQSEGTYSHFVIDIDLVIVF